MKFIFVRHGRDDDRFRGGWSNLDLTPEGESQARLLAGYLSENNAKYRITRILSSDLPRAMATARFISSGLGIPIQPEPLIREANNGDLAGISNDIALIKYPGLFFSTLEMDEPFPNGESPRDFHTRIAGWFADFTSAYRNQEGNILIVTHGGVINVVYHLAKGLNWSNRTLVFPFGHCSIHILNPDTMEFEEENNTGFLLSPFC